MTTIVGIKTKEGVVLGSDRRASKGFFIGSKITQKIAKIDDTLAVAIAGQLSDAEYMIKVAKAERRLMELRRGFPLTVKESARLIANLAYSGLKNYQPYFVELLVAGVDQAGGHILAADMSGAITDEDFASDLTVTRFSGRIAAHPGAPYVARFVMVEAYSHEVSSCGFWPGGGAVNEPAFYAYSYPEPPGFKEYSIQPKEAYYNSE